MAISHHTPESIKRSLTNVRPSDEAIRRIENLREEAKHLVDVLFFTTPECAERTLALRQLEDCVMWAVKAICLNDPDAREIPIGAV
jgi:hypothetical protein